MPFPLTPPFAFKGAPDAVVPPAAPVTVVRQPTMTISYPSGCAAAALLTVDQLPLMNREPQAIPDIPGGGSSYTGAGIEYTQNGVDPLNLSFWSGFGAQFWDLYIDGILIVPAAIFGFDGQVGPFTVSVPYVLDWTTPHFFWFEAVYHDRPAYHAYYMDPATIGLVAFGPPTGSCVGAFRPSIFWNQAGYWNPWVSSHHSVSDTSGPTDRHGAYLGLAGPWGTSVPQQHLRADADPCLDAYSSNIIDVNVSVTYPEIVYNVQSIPQTLPVCIPTRPGTPVFRSRHKL